MRLWVLIAACAAAAAVSARAACETEQDRLVWARERMHPSATRPQLDLVYRWLVNGTKSCPLSGDLWYYRGLAARKTGDPRDAQYAFGKADEYGSEAKRRGFDPFAITPHAPAADPKRIRNKWALLIGVGSFAKSDEFLEFSGKDAKELGDALVESAHFPKSNVKVLVDKQATTGNIREAFGEIRQRAQADDLVLVYVSSHGVPRELDPTGLSYVLTYDTDTSDPARVFATALQMVELAELGRWVRAQGYVLLLDTCYSGAAHPGVAVKSGAAGADGMEPLEGLEGSGNRVVISASQATEKSYEDRESGHGYFTRFLLEALRRNGPAQPMSSIFEYVRGQVSAAVEKHGGRRQHPVMQQFGRGQEIVLTAPVLAATRQYGRGERLAGMLTRGETIQ